MADRNKKPRISELVPVGNLVPGSGNLDPGSEEKISICPFIFRSKLVSMENKLARMYGEDSNQSAHSHNLN